MMHASYARIAWVVAIVLMALPTAVISAEDQEWSRAYSTEIYAITQILGADEVAGLHDTIEISTDTTPVYGVGMGVNFGAHLNLNSEIMLGWLDIEGTLAGDPPVNVRTDNQQIWLWNLNLDYNILKGRLTPLITAGGGVFGYNGDDRVGETHGSYNAGAGVRWDVSKHLAVRVIYRSTWWEIEDVEDPFRFDGVTASLIWMFK